MVSIASPVNAYLFPEYIIPRLESSIPLVSRRQSAVVRANYARCLASLAQSASRFLDVLLILKSEGAIKAVNPVMDPTDDIHPHEDFYDIARNDLMKFFERQTKTLLTDPNPDVRRAFLSSVPSLCVFFGSAQANDMILSHLNTYLNDRDWRLRCSFFDTIVAVAICVGGINLEEFILPLMLQALFDPEDCVVERVLRSLGTLAALGLIQRSKHWQLVIAVTPLAVHCNVWIREASVYAMSACSTFSTSAERECVLKPLLRPYLTGPGGSFTELDLLAMLKVPLPKTALEVACLWAAKAPHSAFWTLAGSATLTSLEDDHFSLVPPMIFAKNALSKVQKDKEDQEWLARLRNCGMTHEDEMKFMALRDYIRRSTRQRSGGTDTLHDRLSRLLNMSSLGVNVETVFFSHEEQHLEKAQARPTHSRAAPTSQTISDAPLHASTHMGLDTEENPAARARTMRGDMQGTTKPLPIKARPGQTSKLSAPASTGEVATKGGDPTRGDSGGHLRQDDGMNDPSDASSPSSVDRQSFLRQQASLQGKGSAIDLMRKKASSSKTGAATSMSSTTAVGTSNSHTRRDRRSPRRPTAALTFDRARPEGGHNYEGRDPNVLKLLDSIYTVSFPPDKVEFGPFVKSVGLWRREVHQVPAAAERWRPAGSLVAAFAEHTASINRVLPSPDSLFFITGSDDGTVRIWDTSRLEQNLANRSKQVFRHDGNTKVTALCFIEDTHCFASADADGMIYLVKVDCIETPQGNVKYGKQRVLRQWKIPAPACPIVWLEHFSSANQSILVVATSDCRVIALEIRRMEILYTLQNPDRNGALTAFCLDSKRQWMLLGTSHGCIDLWDLRFRIRLKSYAFANGQPISRLFLHPAPPEKGSEGREQQRQKRRQKLVCAVGGTSAGEITIWDIETMNCVGVYRVGSALDVPQTDLSARYTLTPSDEPTSGDPGDTVAKRSAPGLQKHDRPTSMVRGLAVGVLTLTSSGQFSDPFFVIAGLDNNVRFWDVHHVERSCIVSGPDVARHKQSPRRVYRRATPATFPPVFEEAVNESAADSVRGNSSSRLSDSRSRANVGAKRSIMAANSNDSQVEHPASAKPPGKESTRRSVINDEQQKLLQSHVDAVLDVAVIERPKRMIVSVDRSGVVMVFS